MPFHKDVFKILYLPFYIYKWKVGARTLPVITTLHMKPLEVILQHLVYILPRGKNKLEFKVLTRDVKAI